MAKQYMVVQLSSDSRYDVLGSSDPKCEVQKAEHEANDGRAKDFCNG